MMRRRAVCDNGQEVSQNDDFANDAFNYAIVILPMSLQLKGTVGIINWHLAEQTWQKWNIIFISVF